MSVPCIGKHLCRYSALDTCLLVHGEIHSWLGLEGTCPLSGLSHDYHSLVRINHLSSLSTYEKLGLDTATNVHVNIFSIVYTVFISRLLMIFCACVSSLIKDHR